MRGTGSTFTQKGIAAVKAGNHNLARQFLEAALAENPNDAVAWLWMTSVAHKPAEKRECLKRVLAIDPDHAVAKRGLELLGREPAAPLAAEPLAPEAPPAAPPPPRTLERRPDTAPRRATVSRPARPRRVERQPRGLPLLLIVLAVAVVGVFVLLAILWANPGEAPTAAVPGQSPATFTRPPTWTLEPTATPRPSSTPRPAPTQLQPLVEEAIRIRALQPIESIHYVLSAQFDLDLYLRNDLDAQSVVLANTFWEELRALGLVGFEVEYDRQQLIDLTSRQLGGFYSPPDKTLYAVTQSSRIEPSEYSVIVHEYAHALADMHFDLSRLFRFGEASTDTDLASRALGEGDAMLVEHSSPWSGYGPAGWDLYARDARSFAALYRRSGVSPALSFVQTFPYVEGWRFVWALREAGGWQAVNQAYVGIPASTEQILHPDKYLTGGDPPRVVTLPEIDAPALAGYQLVAENDTLGEFVLSLLLDEFIQDTSRANRAAAGWGGDALRVWRDRVGRPTYVLLAAWDSEDDAREFWLAAGEMLSIRTGSSPPLEEGVEALDFDGEQGTAYLSRNGDRVLIVWSPDAGLRDEILAAFPDF